MCEGLKLCSAAEPQGLRTNESANYCACAMEYFMVYIYFDDEYICNTR